MKKESFKIAWAKMPIDDEELEKIEEDHRIRPYLLCMDKGAFYYAFPCTSKISKTSRYENEKIVLRSSLSDSPTLVNVGELFVLPKDNILGYEHSVDSKYSNEIIKKINACIKYRNYPQEFIDYLQSKEYKCGVNDLVEVDGLLYVLVGDRDEDFVGYRVYPYPVDYSYMSVVDGLRYYISPKRFYTLKSDEITYRSRLHGIEDDTIIESTTDYSKIYNLEPGMIIKCEDKEKIIVIIILENYKDSLETMVGRDDESYSNFSPLTIPGTAKFEYEVVGYLTSDRVEKLIELKDKKINEKR